MIRFDWTAAALLFTLLATGCTMTGNKSKAISQAAADEEEEEDEAAPGALRRHMHKSTKEADPWGLNLNRFKDERTLEIERNLGIE